MRQLAIISQESSHIPLIVLPFDLSPIPTRYSIVFLYIPLSICPIIPMPTFLYTDCNLGKVRQFIMFMTTQCSYAPLLPFSLCVCVQPLLLLSICFHLFIILAVFVATGARDKVLYKPLYGYTQVIRKGLLIIYHEQENKKNIKWKPHTFLLLAHTHTHIASSAAAVLPIKNELPAIPGII